MRRSPDQVFVAGAGTRQAQREVLDLLLEPFAAPFSPAATIPDAIGVGTAGHSNCEGGQPRTLPPLHAASMLVQEDLILMRKGQDGWRLAAGSLCFPSSWSLTEKFGKPLHEIHEPVPAFGPGTRMAELINRMFDNLAADQPVQRCNWSIQAGTDLYHPLSDRRAQRARRQTAFEIRRRRGFRDQPSSASSAKLCASCRSSGDILFTIRIHLDPLAVLRETSRSATASPRPSPSQLSALDTAQLDYKGLTADRDRLVEQLSRLAAEADPRQRYSLPAPDHPGKRPDFALL